MLGLTLFTGARGVAWADEAATHDARASQSESSAHAPERPAPSVGTASARNANTKDSAKQPGNRTDEAAADSSPANTPSDYSAPKARNAGAAHGTDNTAVRKLHLPYPLRKRKYRRPHRELPSRRHSRRLHRGPRPRPSPKRPDMTRRPRLRAGLGVPRRGESQSRKLRTSPVGRRPRQQ
jgi:pyruvate/2-oxoglutarate dehydrogenase complex dihydrolipoamide acyltransferase (E2) component